MSPPVSGPIAETRNTARGILMNSSPCLVRPATASDLPAINALYNHYVLHSTCTYQETPETEEGRKHWFAAHDAAHPVIVVELNNQIAGWGSLSPYHLRSAFRFTVEDSVYVLPQYQRRGLGAALLQNLLSQAADAGHHTVIAAIDSEQAASITLHTRFGFEKATLLKQVGFKFGRWLDVLYMQRLI